MAVIVGKAVPGTRTPVFMGDMRYVVFRPYWEVPPSIARNELLPAIRKNPEYLSKQNMEIVRNDGTSVSGAEAVDALAAGKARLRQRPGAHNALGAIKFIFPNPYNVYLHGTPAQSLFAQPQRAFSHGCIRVSDTEGLAEFVLKNAEGDWSRERIQKEMKSSGSPLQVNLKQPIRVVIVYGTALATESDGVKFFEDIYGHDRKLETLLKLKPVSAR
jgi:murein L,D-transpeptidase YcbB/YkuD